MTLIRSLPRELLQTLLIALILAVFARAWVVQAFKIPTASMADNLLVGDHLLVNKFVYSPFASGTELLLLPQRSVRRGDVIVFRDPQQPERDLIKRCVAVGGDRVEIRDKQLLINRRPVDETQYVEYRDPHTYPASEFLHDTLRLRDNFGPSLVPQGHVFVLGDNRDNSHDSRFWGTVPEAYLRGRAVLVYWSVETPAVDAERSVLGRTIRDALGVFDRTRWSRTARFVR